MATSFEKSNWQWPLGQFQQRLGEWIEVKLRSIDGTPAFDPFPTWLAGLLVKLCWLVLAVLVLWFGYRIIYPYWQQWLAKNRRVQLQPDLPVQTFKVSELLAKSQQFQREGDYTQATRWLYLAALQRLNDAKLILHQPNLTDREYLKLLATFPAVRSGDILLSTHEQLHFGDRTVTAEDFDRCQQAYQQIESGLGVGVNS
jgi:Domain of unknown function (DUF4129)